MFLQIGARFPSKKRQQYVLPKLLSVLLILGGVLFSKGVYMQGKAFVAQQLLTFAWARYLYDGQLHKAWPWADSAPFAQLTLPGQVPLIILSGASGSNLAFAPAWMVSTAPFAQGGNSVIVAHNDTHFNQLKTVRVDDQVLISTYQQTRLFYQVVEIKVVNEGDLFVLQNAADEQLTLITCYPFDSAIYNSDLRFVVIAKRIKDARSPINFAMLNGRHKV